MLLVVSLILVVAARHVQAQRCDRNTHYRDVCCAEQDTPVNYSLEYNVQCRIRGNITNASQCPTGWS